MSAINAGRKPATAAFADKALRYLRSPSTRWAAFVGLLSYLSYAYVHPGWTNASLHGGSVFFVAYVFASICIGLFCDGTIGTTVKQTRVPRLTQKLTATPTFVMVSIS